jgi:hypothetical protein
MYPETQFILKQIYIYLQQQKLSDLLDMQPMLGHA